MKWKSEYLSNFTIICELAEQVRKGANHVTSPKPADAKEGYTDRMRSQESSLTWKIFVGLEAFVRAVSFVVCLLSERFSDVSVEESKFDLTKGVPAKLYRSRRRRFYRTAVIIHGISPSGYDDRRLVKLGKALASCGYIVVFPDIVQFRQCKIGAESVDIVGRMVRLVCKRPDICTDGRVDAVSACVSASVCLLAAVDTEKIRSVLAFGALADAKEVWEYLKWSKHLDATYGRNVVFRNCWNPENDGLSELLIAALADDHHHTAGIESTELQSCMRKANERDISIYKRWKSDPRFRAISYKDIESSEKFLTGFGAISPVHKAHSTRCERVILIHGADDGIVPASESLRLHNEYQSTRKIEVSCCITTLLEHGKLRTLGFGLLQELYTLLTSFAAFFRRYG